MRQIMFVALLAVALCAKAMTEEEVFGMLDAAFYRDMCYDSGWRPSRFTAQGMTLCQAYTNIFKQTGFSAPQFENMILTSISNRCTNAEFFATNRSNRASYRGAVGAVGRHCGMSALPTLEYAFVNSVGVNAIDEALEIVRLRGTSHDAFARYAQLVSESDRPGLDRAGDLALAVSKCVCDATLPAVVTNRAVGFFLDIAGSVNGCEIVADQTLCSLWQAYTTSSNRYIHVVDGIGRVSNSAVSNCLLNVKSSMEALPPGSMQMLPTNQFYNVED